ncbi:MAG: DEAD/DEAH box helicase [Proteobacteria bacterium]|nr:DEAD/DEAH box helicase [Pseudomonadota bacterium]
MENDIQESKIACTFEDFGLAPAILDGVKAAGYVTPTPIQVDAIPAVLAGKDVIGQAQTGTGKTAAFALPAMSRIKNNKNVEILVLCPTRELATQVADEMFTLGRFAGVKTVPVVGGQHLFRQVELINRGAQVVVATPGRLMDHLREGRLKGFAPSIVILDEADEMLDMGFIDDIRDLLKQLPENRQTLLFSATMPPAIRSLANEFMKDPVHIKLNTHQQANTDIEQRLHVVRADEKENALLRIIDVEDPAKALIFCRTKRDVDEVTEKLLARGIAARGIHGDMGQPQRNQTVELLKSGQIKIVIATDVAARGLDIRGVTHVINYHVPDNRERYVHRIGRTGRAGELGIAITLASAGDLRHNDCFDKKYAPDFKVSAVPRRDAALAKRGLAMAETIKAVEISRDWHAAVEELLANVPTEDLVAKMFSLLMGKRKVVGEDQIGMPKEQAERILMGSGSQGGGGRPPFGRKPFGSKRPFQDRRPNGGSSGSRPFRDNNRERSFGGDRQGDSRGPARSGDRPAFRPSYANRDGQAPRGPSSDRPFREKRREFQPAPNLN